MKKRNQRAAALTLGVLLAAGNLFSVLSVSAKDESANSQVITGTKDIPSAEGVTGTSDLSDLETVTGTREPSIEEGEESLGKYGERQAMSAAMAKEYLDQISAYILSTVENPVCSSTGGEWAVLGLTRYGTITETFKQKYLNNLYDYIEEKHGVLSTNKYTEYSRVVLALTALGEDVRDASGYDLLSWLARLEKVCFQGVNGPIWALIALDCGDYEIPKLDESEKKSYTQSTRENLIRAILDGRNEHGLWESSGAEADMTGMALQALANYYDGEHPEVVETVDQVLLQLSAMQNEDGSYGSIESDAQVLIAMTALGISVEDGRFVKNGHTVLDGMMSYYLGEGAFEHVHSEGADAMATEQGMCALTAYYRFITGENWLYDMSDVERTQEPAITEEEFLRRVAALPSQVHMDDKEEIEFLLRELKRQSSLKNPEDIRKKLEDFKKQTEDLERTIKKLDEDIWSRIDPLKIDLTEKVMIESLKKRYDSLDEKDRKYVTYRQDLFRAVSIIGSIQKGMLPKEVFENIATTGDTFWYHGVIEGEYSYTISIHGKKVENKADMKAGITSGNKVAVMMEGAKFAFSMDQEGALPSEVTLAIHTDLLDGTYYVYRRNLDTNVMKAMEMVEIKGGIVRFSTKAGGDFQLVPRESVEASANPSFAVYQMGETKKEQPKAPVQVQRIHSFDADKEGKTKELTVTGNVIKKEEFDKIKGKDENYKAVCKMEDGKEYSFTFHGADIKTPKDFQTGLSFDSEHKEEVAKLTEDFVLLQFEQEGEFPGETLVEVGVDKEDGEYLLFYYDDEKMQAEYIQKVEIKDKKTKFIIAKGGDYFIAKRSKTGSLKEQQNEISGTETIEKASVVPNLKSDKENPYAWGIVSGAAGIGILGGILLFVFGKRRNRS